MMTEEFTHTSSETAIPATPTLSPSSPATDSAPQSPSSPKKHHNGKGGGLKKSTQTVRNNARVSFKGNYVSRRCIQDIRPLMETRKQTVNVIRVTANSRIAKASGKGVLVPTKGVFFVLNFPRMTKNAFIDALTQTPQERTWIYINEKGVVQVSFEEIAKADAKAEDIVLGTLKIDVNMEGDARIEAQKVGTRIRPETKLAHCVQLDFGGAAQETCRYLWVEETIFEDAVVPNSPVNDQSHSESETEEEEEEVINSEIDEEMIDAARTLLEMRSLLFA